MVYFILKFAFVFFAVSTSFVSSFFFSSILIASNKRNRSVLKFTNRHSIQSLNLNHRSGIFTVFERELCDDKKTSEFYLQSRNDCNDFSSGQKYNRTQEVVEDDHSTIEMFSILPPKGAVESSSSPLMKRKENMNEDSIATLSGNIELIQKQELVVLYDEDTRTDKIQFVNKQEKLVQMAQAFDRIEDKRLELNQKLNRVCTFEELLEYLNFNNYQNQITAPQLIYILKIGNRARSYVILSQEPIIRNIIRQKQASNSQYIKKEKQNDLFQEGTVGVIMALRKYSPERGTKFSSYAYFWIKAYINKAIDKMKQSGDSSVVGMLPSTLMSTNTRSTKVDDEPFLDVESNKILEFPRLPNSLPKEVTKDPSLIIPSTLDNNFSNCTSITSVGPGINRNKIVFVPSSQESTSLRMQQTPDLQDDSEQIMLQMEDKQIKELLLQLLQNILTKREFEVIINRYRLNLSFTNQIHSTFHSENVFSGNRIKLMPREEIASILNLSQQYVAVIEDQAMKKIKHFINQAKELDQNGNLSCTTFLKAEDQVDSAKQENKSKIVEEDKNRFQKVPLKRAKGRRKGKRDDSKILSSSPLSSREDLPGEKMVIEKRQEAEIKLAKELLTLLFDSEDCD